MKNFQFSTCEEGVSPPTEALDAQGKVILTPIQPAETVTQALDLLKDWFTTSNGYNKVLRPYKVVK